MRKALVVLAMCSVLFVGCATTGVGSQDRAKRKAGVGALFGAIAGAAASILTGGNAQQTLKYAAAGAAIGAVTGYAIGKRQDKLLQNRDEAAARYRYSGDDGVLLNVESANMDPDALSPGQTGQVIVVYTILAPSESQTENVTYKNTLYYKGGPVQDYGEEEANVSDGGGTLQIQFPLTLPSNCPAGTYSMRTQVTVNGVNKSDIAETTFYVGS